MRHAQLFRVRFDRRRSVAVAVVVSMLAATVQTLPGFAGSAAASPEPRRTGHVTAVPPHFNKPVDKTTRFTPHATTWPKPVRTAVTLGTSESGPVHAAGGPVWAQSRPDRNGRYQGPAGVDVEVLDQNAAKAAGISGVLFTVDPGTAAHGSGTINVGVDYSGFAEAYGGNYGSRLRLVQLPTCALSTPDAPSCRAGTPLLSTNDTKTQTVSAPVSLDATPAGTKNPLRTSAASNTMVFAATTSAGASGSTASNGAGSYDATSLTPSGTWQAGGSSGSFTFNYPIEVPPAPSGLVPPIGLAYDSGRLDGQTASTWAQSSWVGDGWSTPQSYIEQSFASCSDDPEGTASPVATNDECYNGPILTLSLDGSSTALVWDASKQVWKAEHDGGDVVTHVSNSGNGSGTYNTDYWTVRDRSGNLYMFGRNQLPGWSSGKATTNSVDSEPVFSAHAGDPCYDSAGFSASVCTMAYRWNLDYVVDVHGNAMSFYYQQDTNFYGKNKGETNVSYVRDSHLDHIDYGFTDGNAYGTAPDRVKFNTDDRCVSGTCQPLNATNSANWPDVPFDLICAAGSTCTSYSPSFFSTVRLTSVATQQYSPAISGYTTIDTYALSQTLPTPQDQTSPTLWLSSITHTGSDVTAAPSSSPITLPSVSFTPTALANRVDSSTYQPLYRYRIATVTTETGSVVSVAYNRTNPCSTPVTINPATNTSSCYPIYWTPVGYTAPVLDWFNKYVVKSVTQTDPTGGARAQSTSYSYSGPAWHYDDNEVVQAKYRTYGQFRGYADVKTFTGDTVTDPQTESETTYYQGMSKNNNTTVVNRADSVGGQHEDVDQLSGSVLESTEYLGSGGPVDHSTINSYWVSSPTATRSRTGLPALTAVRVAPVETYTRRAVTSGGTTTWQALEVDNSYNANTDDALFGTVQHVYTHTVPANPAYDQCTTTTYAPANTAANLVGLATEAETDSVACGGFTEGSPASVPGATNTLTAPATVNRPAQVVSNARAFYDDPTFSTTFPQPASPTKGDVTMTRKAADYIAGAFVYQTSSRTGYDTVGRAIATYDGNGNKTTNAYTTNAVGLTTAITVSNALNQSATTTLDPQRGIILTNSDLNGVVTTSQYDALGRRTAVWFASRQTTGPANYTYSYQLSNSGTTAVTTSRLNKQSTYDTMTVIYDGLLRARQTQSPTAQGGRLIVDTFYDSRGWVASTNNGWWDCTTAPNTTVVAPSQTCAQANVLPSQNVYVYDGLGRAVLNHSEQNGVVISTTTNIYNGDRTTTIPPTGGVTTTTVLDPAGRAVEVDEYKSQPVLVPPSSWFTGTAYLTGGTTVANHFGFDSHGNENTVTDQAGNTWTATFNLLGQVIAKTDPDAGTTAKPDPNTASMVYDGAGNLVQVTDSRGKTISYTFDALNRKTGEYDAVRSGQNAGNQLAAWVYDNANNAVSGMTNPLGHLTTATAYWGGKPYVTQALNFNTFGKSLGETMTIPASEGFGSVDGVTTSYSFRHVYEPNNGLPTRDQLPAGGGLPSEFWTYTYTSLDLPSGVGSSAGGYAQQFNYDAWGHSTGEVLLGSGGNTGTVTNSFDLHTGRLLEQNISTTTGTTTSTVNDESYKYDLAGNITRQASTRRGASAPTETQCYTYDDLARLTQAWTATDNCAATPSDTNHTMVGDSLGSTSAYWTSWTINDLGERTAQTQHNLGTGAGTTTAYTYDGNGGHQPHTLTSTTSSGGASSSTGYSYDTAGNMVSRNAGQGNQTLTWDDAGRLTKIATTGSTSTFIYDAEGKLLIQRDPGSTTLYLEGEQLVLNTSTGVVTGTRYCVLPGGIVAIRSGSSTNYQFEFTDQHGTPTLYLDSTLQNATWRQTTPYGEPRGTAATWPDNHGFLNAPAGTVTGLTRLGAREYDPATAQFISVDPVLDGADPQQVNGYGYARNNPLRFSDPTGLRPPPDDCTGSCLSNWAGAQGNSKAADEAQEVATGGSPQAHDMAIALRIVQIEAKYPGAIVSASVGGMSGPDLVCYNCAAIAASQGDKKADPTEIWVWEITTVPQDGSARKIKQLQGYIDQLNKDPLVKRWGMHAVAGPKFDEDGGPAVVPFMDWQEVTVSSSKGTPGLELYKVTDTGNRIPRGDKRDEAAEAAKAELYKQQKRFVHFVRVVSDPSTQGAVKDDPVTGWGIAITGGILVAGIVFACMVLCPLVAAGGGAAEAAVVAEPALTPLADAVAAWLESETLVPVG
ncbi:RHS repeat-associated core domain-containing protein [Dactylosporangium sp. CA-233914]|uniref:RHS repeat domain-containing protein n=1 Tax=Dactylosporangium sp. CA-233914 TaxID=3239934 RepID=UPI003D8FBB8C